MTNSLEQLVGNMTVSQLADAAGMEVDAVVSLVLIPNPTANTSRPAKKAPKSQAAAKEPDATAEPKTGELNTRSRAGREALDQAIVDFLAAQQEPVRALDIRKGIGGTAAQIRTRLNVLIEKGKVNYKGRASGTRYRAA